MQSSEDVQNRGLSVASSNSYATHVDRWAIVVGISKYKHENMNLRYADRDAEEVYKLLLSSSGGNFKADHVIKLTNDEATTAKITQALRSFLKKPAREDLVFIYFACHGSPDFDRPGNVYMLTHDTDPNDIAGTALPMREIDLSLRENLLAEKVIVLADTCHSAAIGGGIGRRSTADNANLVNRYLTEVSTARGGVALLTSAEANEVSFEDAKWGGGHGVFTYYLLKGMQGEADLNQNGVVTVGELFEYVRDKVKEATEHRQHPSIGTNPYDRNLPLAITFSDIQNFDQSTKSKNSPQDIKPDLEQKKIVPQERGWQIVPNKMRVVVAIALLGTGIITASIFVFLYQLQQQQLITTSTSQKTTGSKTARSFIKPGILKDHEIRIYFPSSRNDLKKKAETIRNLFDPTFRLNNVVLLPQDNTFFHKYNYPNPDVRPPANEIRYTSSNSNAAKYLEEVLKENLHSEQFHSLPIGSQYGKYVSIFLGP